LHRGLSEAGIAQLLTDDPRVVVLALDLVDRGSRISGHHHNPPREYACGHLRDHEAASRREVEREERIRVPMTEKVFESGELLEDPAADSLKIVEVGGGVQYVAGGEHR